MMVETVAVATPLLIDYASVRYCNRGVSNSNKVVTGFREAVKLGFLLYIYL